ncbi:MAG: type II secretion system protein [Candidatus Gracilibacteria bacterium]|jgi:prepilin-type N-terminal cleavage/methylation domain-containing protein
MRKAPQTRKAFTLIEMLVVITIVGIIGAVAVGNYAATRKQAKLELGVDTLISIFKEQEQKAKSGQLVTFQEAGKSQTGIACYGVDLRVSDSQNGQGQGGQPVVPVQYLINPYHAVQGNDADACGANSVQTMNISSFEDLEISKISLMDQNQSSQDQNDLKVFYKPPLGKRDFVGVVNSVQQMKIVIGLVGTADKRCFVLNNTTGVFSILTPDQC